ncbi:MAG: WYL domain-containing protein [Lachnospiraceae bacterium]
MRRTTAKPSNFEKCYRILEYLKWNTDAEHTMKQADLRKADELKEYIKDKSTLNDILNNMANTINFDGDAIKEEKDWRLVFDEFIQEYGEIAEIEEEDENLPWIQNKTRRPISNIYYQPLFSQKEIHAIVDSLEFSKTLDSDFVKELVKKIEENLTNKYYRKGAEEICRVYEPALTDYEELSRNIVVIQEAIEKKQCIEVRFCGYNHRKQLEPVRATRDVLSPHYLVASNGKYYLLGCWEWLDEEEHRHNMSIWRVDMMKDVQIAREPDGEAIPATAKENVQNLPAEWKEQFQLSHLNMSYDEPQKIRLRIKSPKEDGKPQKHQRPDYTFLHDWFGDTFRYFGRDPQNADYDFVEVDCSPFAMVNWALQYSDRVEVVEPVEVREQVKKKVDALYQKYECEKIYTR